MIVRAAAQEVRDVGREPDGADDDGVILGGGEHLAVHRHRVRHVPGALHRGGPVVHQVIHVPAPHPVTPVILAEVSLRIISNHHRMKSQSTNVYFVCSEKNIISAIEVIQNRHSSNTLRDASIVNNSLTTLLKGCCKL